MQLALTVAGAAIGFQIGGPQGAAIGASIGSATGAYFFGPEMPDIEGPRLTDLKVQTSTFGAPIPMVYGAYRLTGNVIYSTDIIETRKDEEVGGKGGGVTQTTYSYSVSCAVGVCEGPVDGIRRIWANGKLIYNADTGLVDGDIGDMRIYLGEEDQSPDPFWQGFYGADNVPAHRGLAYVTFENLQLATFGNRLPNFSFEVYPVGQTYWISQIKTLEGEIFYFYPYATKVYNNDIYTVGLLEITDEYIFGFGLLKQDKDGNIISIKQIAGDTISYSKSPGLLNIKNNYIYICDSKNIIKLDLNLNVIYSKEYSSSEYNINLCSNVDDNDNFYIFSCDNNNILTKLNQNGEVVWTTYYSSDAFDDPTALDFLADGSIIVLTNGGVVLKYNSDGELLFAKLIAADRVGYISTSSLAVDNENNILIGGVEPIDGPYDIQWFDWLPVIIKLDSDANVLFSRHIRWGAQIDFDFDTVYAEHKVTFDLNNNIYFESQFDSYDESYQGNRLIVKFDKNGNYIWSKKFNALFESNGNIEHINSSISTGTTSVVIAGWGYTTEGFASIAKMPQAGFGNATYDDFLYENIELTIYDNITYSYYFFETTETTGIITNVDTDITVNSINTDVIENIIYQVT